VVVAFGVKEIVVTVWPAPPLKSVALEMAAVQVLSLYRVTVALSDKSIVTVGV
jgi:hypothetical protein